MYNTSFELYYKSCTIIHILNYNNSLYYNNKHFKLLDKSALLQFVSLFLNQSNFVGTPKNNQIETFVWNTQNTCLN